jgi:hypothetical protein
MEVKPAFLERFQSESMTQYKADTPNPSSVMEVKPALLKRFQSESMTREDQSPANDPISLLHDPISLLPSCKAGMALSSSPALPASLQVADTPSIGAPVLLLSRTLQRTLLLPSEEGTHVGVAKQEDVAQLPSLRVPHPKML